MADDVARLTLSGALGVPRYPEIRTAFESAPRDAPLLIDLRGATTVDPTFLAELLLFQRRRLPAPIGVLVPPGSEVARVFGLATVRDKVAVYEDEATALSALETA